MMPAKTGEMKKHLPRISRMDTNGLERQSRNQRILEMPGKKAHGEHEEKSLPYSPCNILEDN